jgi:hypothetical protein
MSQLRCLLGFMSTGLPQVANPLTLAADRLERFFERASVSNGQAAIELRFEGPSQVRNVPAGPVTALDLHNGLQSLLNNPLATKQVDRVGVLFAHSYAARPALFGVMFDRGFATEDDPNDAFEFVNVPREGCAVFLGAIRAKRATEQDFQAEVAFTTIHELGHVFNLGHIQNPLCFMSSSLASHILANTAFRFLPGHMRRLSLGINSPNVWPGGSDYLDLGLLGPLEPGESFNLPRSEFGLELLVDMDQKEFHAYEPVELEIELSVANGIDRSFQVPDVLDPGYDAFDIWIERPNGERVKYRPSRFYCGTGSKLRIIPTKPFQRDVSIFGQSGGYTFRHAGLHRLYATLALPRKGLLQSNEIEINILPNPLEARQQELQSCLTRRSAARLLYYRDGEPNDRGIEYIDRICRNFPREPSAAAAHYALGRLFLRKLQMASRKDIGLRDMAEAAYRHLTVASDHKRLSRHRRSKAEALLLDLPRPRHPKRAYARRISDG